MSLTRHHFQRSLDVPIHCRRMVEGGSEIGRRDAPGKPESAALFLKGMCNLIRNVRGQQLTELVEHHHRISPMFRRHWVLVVVVLPQRKINLINSAA
jgi:hypothetical protein